MALYFLDQEGIHGVGIEADTLAKSYHIEADIETTSPEQYAREHGYARGAISPVIEIVDDTADTQPGSRAA